MIHNITETAVAETAVAETAVAEIVAEVETEVVAEVEARARAATAEFNALQVSQRPTFVIESAIGDEAVFSGLAVAEPLIATIEAMSRDEAGYAAHKAHFGGPPA